MRVFGGRAVAPSWVTVAPMVQGETTCVGGDAEGGFPEELSVGVVGHFLWCPVEPVFVVAEVGAEADSGGSKEF